jgi:hypothetical protein
VELGAQPQPLENERGQGSQLRDQAAGTIDFALEVFAEPEAVTASTPGRGTAGLRGLPGPSGDSTW